jgi:hypothetical protein
MFIAKGSKRNSRALNEPNRWHVVSGDIWLLTEPERVSRLGAINISLLRSKESELSCFKVPEVNAVYD